MVALLISFALAAAEPNSFDTTHRGIVRRCWLGCRGRKSSGRAGNAIVIGFMSCAGLRWKIISDSTNASDTLRRVGAVLGRALTNR
jgi:hypothetical protein